MDINKGFGSVREIEASERRLVKNYPPPVKLTLKLLDVMNTALAYATAGGPADIGLEENAEGYDTLAEIERAHLWVGQEIARRKSRSRRAPR